MADPLTDNRTVSEPGPTWPGFVVRVRSIEEAELLINSLTVRVDQLGKIVGDHSQRFDTAQTHQWKRIWFWLRWGWPMTDWNADRPSWRPWNRSRRAG